MSAPTDLARADQLGFEQFVHSLAQHLRHTPFGWALVLGLSWGQAPLGPLLLWLGVFALVWLPSLWFIWRCGKRGPVLAQDRGVVYAVAALDGLGWGVVVWVLAGLSPVLDSWVLALLCGLAALSAVVYLTQLQAFRLYLGAMGLGLLACVLIRQVPDWRLAIAFGVFALLLLRLLQPVSARLEQGRLHEIGNESLAARLSDSLARKEVEAATDALTGLLNRRSLDALLQAGLSGPVPRQMALLMLDIDHFKQINDRHGHACGDAALRAFADRVRAQLRDGDHCARYGGEEFVVLLPGASRERAVEIAERLRLAVQGQPLLSQPLVDNTVSIGVSVVAPMDQPAHLLERADAALYRAKSEGRNRVCVA
ncbi:diguanylate cyclase (GGDEF)-like protein [Inhella inkyongensis]|uniref:diguanylate cyclase n=1 Tax=Inhella inkyongensis TaxID=392593 RepID=A0A840S221_9BURK|nr:GGDEF domain-containing protein [Inhella inkyongensis]MBB5202904.1 diguanylate cyclase (GGDEF)-like protein [Inhella inkyongensis]